MLVQMIWLLVFLSSTCGYVAVSAAGPTYETVDKAEVVWEVPENPKGTLFVAHGCNHGAVDFWPKSDACPACIGLPEETNITRRALARGYAVVAISSHDRHRSRCWHVFNRHHAGTASTEQNTDVSQVLNALKVVREKAKLDKLPLYALGASSGGSFVLFLAMVTPLAGVCSQIMAISPRMMQLHFNTTESGAPGAGGVKPPPYPPTMMVHMPRDEGIARHVAGCIATLTKQGVPSKEVKVLARPITPTFFSDRFQGMEVAKSKSIYAAIKAGGHLDEEDMLKVDPRWATWREALAGKGLQPMELRPDMSPVAELLNLAYANHEIVSDTTDLMLDWFESQAAATSKAATA